MFSPDEMRCIKEAFFTLNRYRFGTRAKDVLLTNFRHLSKYLLPHNSIISEKGDGTEALYRLRQLQTLPYIPWPDDNCALFCFGELLPGTRSDTTRIEEVPDVELVVMVRDANASRNFAEGEWIDPTTGSGRSMKEPGMETVVLTAVGLMNGNIHVDMKLLHLLYLEGERAQAVAATERNEILKTEPSIIQESLLGYINELLTGGGQFWVAGVFPLADFRQPAKSWQAAMQPQPMRIKPAMRALGAITSLISPCHYTVDLTLKEGFGTNSQRRAYKGTNFMSIIPYDRLHKYAPTNGTHASPKVHKRRSHIRHLWKEAGIDRFELPDSPGERLQLVSEQQVRRIYISPTWVGARKFSTKDWDCEVKTSDRELPLLPRSAPANAKASTN